MGPDAALYPEQMVVLDTDADAARSLARKNMALYLRLPNYTNNLLRLGFEQSDIDGGPGGGPSDRLVDAIVAWGTPEQVTVRVRSTSTREPTMWVCRSSPTVPTLRPTAGGTLAPFLLS